MAFVRWSNKGNSHYYQVGSTTYAEVYKVGEQYRVWHEDMGYLKAFYNSVDDAKKVVEQRESNVVIPAMYEQAPIAAQVQRI